MLHYHSHDFYPIHDEVSLPFNQDRPILDKVEANCLGVMRDRDNLIGPGARLAQIN